MFADLFEAFIGWVVGVLLIALMIGIGVERIVDYVLLESWAGIYSLGVGVLLFALVAAIANEMG
jgi:hypothetical protein